MAFPVQILPSLEALHLQWSQLELPAMPITTSEDMFATALTRTC